MVLKTGLTFGGGVVSPRQTLPAWSDAKQDLSLITVTLLSACNSLIICDSSGFRPQSRRFVHEFAVAGELSPLTMWISTGTTR